LSGHPIRLRKRDLAIKLQNISPHPYPKVGLEQYTIPADLAAEILFTACYSYDDIEGKRVLDLGTGTGRLAVGASLLSAGYVAGVDIDLLSLAVAARVSKALSLRIDWALTTVESLRGSVDTVVMNPPFGTKQPHADLDFLNVGLGIGRVVYSIHKRSTRTFLKQWLEKKGYVTSEIMTTRMKIPHQFKFHRKRKEFVSVSVIRTHKNSAKP
jgi:putative methylase